MFHGNRKDKRSIEKEKDTEIVKEKEKKKKNTVYFVTNKQIKTVSNYDSKE